MTAIDTLIEAARKQETSAIYEAAREIGGGQVTTEERMVRAALIEVIVEREGEVAADALMDEMGI